MGVKVWVRGRGRPLHAITRPLRESAGALGWQSPRFGNIFLKRVRRRKQCQAEVYNVPLAHNARADFSDNFEGPEFSEKISRELIENDPKKDKFTHNRSRGF